MAQFTDKFKFVSRKLTSMVAGIKDQNVDLRKLNHVWRIIQRLYTIEEQKEFIREFAKEHEEYKEASILLLNFFDILEKKFDQDNLSVKNLDIT